MTIIPRLHQVADAAPVHKAIFTVAHKGYTSDGQASSMDAATFIENDRTYVPVRFLAYALGIPDSGIKWDDASQSVTLSRDADTVRLVVGSPALYVNGRERTMDVG